MSSDPDRERVDGGERYLIKTEFGDVLVTVNAAAKSGLDPDLLTLDAPTPETTRALSMEIPLRAFAAKMIDLVERFGVGEVTASEAMKRMLVGEKATAELKRIERWARERAEG